MTSHLLRDVRPYGEDAVDVRLVDGRIAEIGTGLSAGDSRELTGGGGPAAGAGRPAHAPARAGPRGRRDRRDRHAGSGSRRVHRRARHGQHRPGRRHGRRRRAGLAARARRRATATSRRSAPSRSACGGEQMAELGSDGRQRRTGPRVLRRRQVRQRRQPHAAGARVRQGVRRRHRPARPGAEADRRLADERGRQLLAARPHGLARGRRGGDHRPRLPADGPRRQPPARLPRQHRRQRRADPLGQGQGLGRHRRGDPAPPAC